MDVLHRELESLRREGGACRNNMDETVDRSAPSICAGKKEERQETRRRLIYLCSLRYNHPTRKDGDRRRRLVGFYERSECYSVQFLPEYRRPLCRRKGSESVVWQERDQRDHTRSSLVLNFNQSSAFSALGGPDRGLLRSISSVSSHWTRRSPWSSELAQSGYLDLFPKKMDCGLARYQRIWRRHLNSTGSINFILGLNPL
jgi:hypothetical protein